MKTIKIHDISMPDDVKKILDIQHKYYDIPLEERFYMAYETEPNNPISTLFTDLKWISKFYGVTLFDENCDITDKSLNDGRDIEIAKNKDMIKRNIHWHDYNYVNENGMVNYIDKYGNPTSKTITNDMGYKEKVFERKPCTLTKDQRNHLQSKIDKGRYIICRFVYN